MNSMNHLLIRKASELQPVERGAEVVGTEYVTRASRKKSEEQCKRIKQKGGVTGD